MCLTPPSEVCKIKLHPKNVHTKKIQHCRIVCFLLIYRAAERVSLHSPHPLVLPIHILLLNTCASVSTLYNDNNFTIVADFVYKHMSIMNNVCITQIMYVINARVQIINNVPYKLHSVTVYTYARI